MNAALIAHCDWSIDRSKRWMAVAVNDGSRWILSPPELVGETRSLLERLTVRRGEVGAILMGFDFPIGLPEGYARAAGLPSFREALGLFGSDLWSRWYSVAQHRDEISVHRPFYPARPGGTRRSHQLGALGVDLATDLLRRCERRTADRQAACSLFWTLGGNQVGKGAITGWREIIVPNLDRVGLWPFDGQLADLTDSNPVVIAETYPADVYGRLGIRRGGWSKKKHEDRQRLGGVIREWLTQRRQIIADDTLETVSDGFGGDKAGEDRFDAFVGLLGMIEVVSGLRSEGTPKDRAVHLWEGWILGHHRGGNRESESV